MKTVLAMAAMAAVVGVTGCSGAASGGRPRSTGDPGSRQPSTVAASAVATPPPTGRLGLGRVVARYRSFAGAMAFVNPSLFVSDTIDPQGRLDRVDPATGRIDYSLATPPGAAYTMSVGPDELLLTHPFEDPASPPAPISRVASTGTRVLGVIKPPNSYAVAVVSRRMWALDESDDSLDRIDPASGRVLQRVKTGSFPFCLLSAFGSLWVGNHHGDDLTRVDPRTGRVVARVSSGPGPGRLAAGAGSVWAADWNSDSVTRIDPGTDKIIATVHVTSTPNAIAFAGGALWLVDAEAGQVFRIDPVTDRVVDVVAIQPGDAGADALSAAGYLWVSVAGQGTFKIDPRR